MKRFCRLIHDDSRKDAVLTLKPTVGLRLTILLNAALKGLALQLWITCRERKFDALPLQFKQVPPEEEELVFELLDDFGVLLKTVTSLAKA